MHLRHRRLAAWVEVHDPLGVARIDGMLTINRCAVVLLAKQPMLDWVNSTDPDAPKHTFDDLRNDTEVYLVPEADSNRKVEAWLRRHHAALFEARLEGWWTDPSDWPADRDFRMFKQWFEIQIHSIVVDLADQPLYHDEEE